MLPYPPCCPQLPGHEAPLAGHGAHAGGRPRAVRADVLQPVQRERAPAGGLICSFWPACWRRCTATLGGGRGPGCAAAGSTQLPPLPAFLLSSPYFLPLPQGYYFTGDGARRDEDGCALPAAEPLPGPTGCPAACLRHRLPPSPARFPANTQARRWFACACPSTPLFCPPLLQLLLDQWPSRRRNECQRAPHRHRRGE